MGILIIIPIHYSCQPNTTAKQELAELGLLPARVATAEDALRRQTSAFEEMKVQMKAQVDLTQTQAENDKTALANQYATERREFVGHLESAVGQVRRARRAMTRARGALGAAPTGSRERGVRLTRDGRWISLPRKVRSLRSAM